MYLPVNSPTSPQDVQMADLNMLSSKDAMAAAQSPVGRHSFGDHTAISTAKSTDTLRNNIDVKNEAAKKRTSLILNDNGNNEPANGCESPGSSTSSSTGQHQQPVRLATVKRCSRNLDNARYRFDQANNNRASVFDRSSSSSTDSDSAGGTADANAEPNANGGAEPLDNGKLRRLRRKSQADKVQSATASGTPSNESDAEDGGRGGGGDKSDRRNGNGSDASTQKRDSVTSKGSSSATSSDDYFLCEKFKNSINAKLCNDVVSAAVCIGDDMDADERRAALELLSPHEGPLGRRYAEVASNKAPPSNKW